VVTSIEQVIACDASSIQDGRVRRLSMDRKETDDDFLQATSHIERCTVGAQSDQTSDVTGEAECGTA
jgi:hypothetical protein